MVIDCDWGVIFYTSHSIEYTLYAPNMDNLSFFKNVMTVIIQMSQTNLVIGRGFSCMLDPYLDRSSSSEQVRNNSHVFLNTFINNCNTSDVWGIADPSSRDYFYTRIDYFLLDAQLMPHVTDTKFYNIVMSTHFPVTIVIGPESMSTLLHRSYTVIPHALWEISIQSQCGDTQYHP